MLIMTFVENEIDCFRLAVTCQHCWAIGAHEIQRRYTAQLPCMMGDRIIHVSVELDPDDLPHSLVLTPSEREELRKPLPRWGDEVSADGFTTPLFLLAEAKFLPSPEDPKDSWIEIMQDEVPKVYWEFLHSLFQRRPFDANKLVLRNLTRAQYVHSAAYLALHEGLRTIHLGMVVLLCVSWTPYAYGPLALDTKYRGIWAGERLEVVSEELHAKKLLEEEKEWTDVGEEVMQVVTAVLQSVGEWTSPCWSVLRLTLIIPEMTEPEY